MIMARRNKAESNLKGYREEMCVVEGGQVSKWTSANVRRGVTQTDRVTAGSNFGEFFLYHQGERSRAFAKGQAVPSEPEFKPESESESEPKGVFNCTLESESAFESAFVCATEVVPRRAWLNNRYFPLPESSSHFGDSSTPLVSHPSQQHRSLLPCC